MSGFRRKLPAERKLGEFLNDLSRCLKDSGITDYIIQPRQAIETDVSELPPGFDLAAGTTILPVSISFESSFELAFAFLSRLEALERLTHLKSIEWLNDERHVGRITTAIVLHTYHRPRIED